MTIIVNNIKPINVFLASMFTGALLTTGYAYAINDSQYTKTQETVSESSPVHDELTGRNLEISINGKSYIIDMSQDHTIVEAQELYSGVNLPVTIKSDDAITPDTVSISNIEPHRNGTDFTYQLNLKELNRNSFIPIKIESNGNTREYYVRTLPESFPKIDFSGKTKIDKEQHYYMNIYAKTEGDLRSSDDYVAKYDASGNVEYYQSKTDHEIANFNRFDAPDGFSGYYYFEQDDTGLLFNHNSFRKGKYVIMDEGFNVIDEITPLNTPRYDRDHPKAEVHDFRVLGNNHYLLFDSYDGFSDEHNMQKQETYIQEINGGKVVWEWYSGDHDIFSTAPVHAEAESLGLDKVPSLDNIHTNSIAIDPKDGNVVVSSRQMDNIIKISKETGEIMWVLGGEHNQFDYNGMPPFSRQHDADFDDKGRLTLYDNSVGNDHARGLILELDEENKRIVSYKELTDGDQQGIYTGDIEAISDHKGYLVNWGMTRSEPFMATVFNNKGKAVKRIIPEDRDLNTYRIYVHDK